MSAHTPSTSAVAAPDRRLQPVIAVLTTATLWTVTAELLPSGLLPAMSQGLGVGESVIGTLVSAWALTIAVVSIPLVRATLRVQRRLLLAIAVAVIAATNLITAFAPGFELALAGRVLTAIPHGLFWAVIPSYLATIVDSARLGRALSIVLSGPTIAGLAALPAAAFLSDIIGWRLVFAGLTAILAATATALWMLLPPRIERQAVLSQDAGHPEPEPKGAWDRSAVGVIGVAIASGLVLVGHFTAFTYVTILVTGFGGLSDTAIPAVLLLLGITGAVGIAASGFVADRFPRTAITATAALLALGLAVMRLGANTSVVFVAGTAVWGLAIGAFPPILQARVMRMASARFRPVAGSIVITILNLGIAAGAAIGGLAVGLGPSWIVTLALTAAVAGSALLLVVRPTPPHDLARPPA